MSNNITKKEDIRITKTDRAIIDSLTKLLEKRCFTQITTMDICKKALISRATFYAHFDDKYDLLKKWLAELKEILIRGNETYSKLESSINQYTYNNKTIIKNVIKNANEEVLELICEWIVFDLFDNIKDDGAVNDVGKVVSSSFYAGGILHYLHWQVKNKFPAEVPMANSFIYQIIKQLKNIRETF